MMKGTGRLIFTGLSAVTLAVGAVACNAVAGSQNDGQAPTFTVEPFWPQPLEYPNILGSVNGVAIDAEDHVFVVHGGMATLIGRTEAGAATDPVTGECCVPAPYVLEFDATGALVNSFGGEGAGYTWPAMPNGVAIDPEGNVWIGGSEETDSQILKFSGTGEFIAEFGEAGQEANNSTASFGGPADFAFDADANEAFVADGYGNRRVAIVDISTGEIKRTFGAYGNPPEGGEPAAYDPAAAEPAQQFGVVSCVALSDDDLLYVCDRTNNRIQVFQTDGTFVSEVVVAPQTLGEGSVWDVAFSADDDQRFLYVADGSNHTVHVLDRETLTELTNFGRGGRYPGHFYGVHSLATDSQGNVFTGETYHGKRVQKFVNNGLAPVVEGAQDVPWPEGEL